MQVALHYDVKIRSYYESLNYPTINRQFVREASIYFYKLKTIN
jgi:hypothetical protein